MKTLILFALGVLVCATAGAQVGPIQSNSLVRFRVTYGAVPLGDIDVELFDIDKPATVSNFLVYAQSGAYSNGILHRLVPNFIVQGGFVTVANPLSGSAFTSLQSVPERAAISNEFLLGPRYSNTFGTLAMALFENSSSPGNPLPHSATTSWFLNLTNNSSTLDSQQYTVFGRITSGTNLLTYLNTLGENNGIVNMTNNAFISAGCTVPVLSPATVRFPMIELPVAPTSGTCPRFSDLLRVEVIMLDARDVLPPTVAITSPKSGTRLTNENVTVSGTARDNAAVAQVFVALNGGTAQEATTNAFGNWTITLTNVPPGTNTILVSAFDTSSNRTDVVRKFFRIAEFPLSLTINGLGTVKGATNGMMLELGRGYTLVAKPDRDQLFADWSGSTSSISATLQFLMESNLSFTATFVTNLFPLVMGTYNGLFTDTNTVEQISSGFLTMKVSKTGKYSGKVLLNGKGYSMKGILGAYGAGDNSIVRKGTNGLAVQLNLDLTNGTDRITGMVSEETSSNTLWTATLIADRAVFNKKLNPASEAGNYTLIFPPDTSSAAGPAGDGYGTVKLSTAGKISFSGSLADGTKVSQRTGLSKNGEWPFYAPLHKGKGALISWVMFDTNQPDTDFNGLFNWFKQTQKAKYYADGFTNEATIVGSLFTKPASGVKVLDITNAVVGFTNGNLVADFANDVTLNEKNKIINEDANKLKLSISKSKGTISGSVTPPTGGKSVKFKGVILQKQNSGSGYFINSNASGGVFLKAR